jgi:rhomboid protease GluP
MLKRKKTGSVLCPSCGKLVGVNDEKCYYCGRRNPGMWGLAPLLRRIGHDWGFMSLVTYGCVLLYVATLVIDPRAIRTGGMSILAPSSWSVFIFGASGALPVFGYGRWWTVLSAAWLHGGVLHILFNLLWIRQLAPAVSELFGSSRMIIIYTVASITGFLLSSSAALYFSNPNQHITLGASASIFGLLGALVVYGRRGGSSHIGGQAMTYAVILFVFGFIMPGIDNFAHLGGFLGGYAMARWMDPLQPERGDHMIAALICIVLSGISILASVLTSGVL